MTPHRLRKNYKEVMLEDESIILITRDGLLYLVSLTLALPKLAAYPKVGDFWYFNQSLDRPCAEFYGDVEGVDYVAINPSIVRKEFPPVAIY